MPTPESERFLSKKPTVPPTYDGVDFADHDQVLKARDSIIREQWVQVMMARLVREEMGKCYVREGVNHLEKCAKYRDRYLQLLKTAKVRGYLGQEKNYVPGVDGPSSGPEIKTDYPTPQQALSVRGSDLRPGNTIGKGKNEAY